MESIAGGINGGQCFLSAPAWLGGVGLSVIPGFAVAGSYVSYVAGSVFKYCLQH